MTIAPPIHAPEKSPQDDRELPAALLKLRMGVRLITMTATTNLLDAAQRAVRQTVAPALAVSLAQVRDPGAPPDVYRPGITVMPLHETGPAVPAGNAQRGHSLLSVTIEVSTCLRKGRVVPAYILHVAGSDKAGPLYTDAEAALSAALEWVRGSKRPAE
ncbi:hypothetical protein C4901_09130 [Acidiferrobacter sp. SPIII_3]|uniref:hypothetical protein n=1 Tax=Acidiferrobacter sp. SPIII_3 TaxID=1281578 RepID=UPI000D72BDB4|nr:hypothetical protein [Acidiferrobacter sp. SPIII_3]AWP23474.1 hypothetical protein C4901_09130 [Acidiferrobacter sp. SPIII_3]